MSTAVGKEKEGGTEPGCNVLDQKPRSSISTAHNGVGNGNCMITNRATPAVQREKTKEQVSPSDERDEYGQHLKHRLVGTKNQPRAPPSPSNPVLATGRYQTPDALVGEATAVTAETFDWMGEGYYHQLEDTKNDGAQGSSLQQVRREIKYRTTPTQQRTGGRHHSGQSDDTSSFLLFTQSFDTLSEGGDYLPDIQQAENFGGNPALLSPGPGHQRNPTTPRAEITLPGLDHTHSESDCSFVDVSPIKVSRRPDALQSSPMAGPYLVTTPGQYPPPCHVMQTNASHMTTRGAPHPYAHMRHEHDYHWRRHGHPGGGDEQFSNPFFVIRSCQRAFIGYAYLLPCLREHGIVTVNLNRFGHIQRYQGKHEALDAHSIDLVIATRRIETAICVFGGNLNAKRPTHQTSSIFRLKGADSNKNYYEQQLPQRYHVGASRVSWEVEANPPISLGQSHAYHAAPGNRVAAKRLEAKRSPHLIVDDAPGGKRAGGLSSPNNTAGPKIKYRCKLCGQLKQNHNCTFRQSLQRSIGVQVFSAVNAFTAREPGSLAPALSKMNNFVSYDSGHSSHPPSEEGISRVDSHHNSASQREPASTVTPQSIREGGLTEIHSPQSSLSTNSQDMSPDGMQNAARNHHYHVNFSSTAAAGNRKRSHSHFLEGQAKPFHHMAFCPSVALRPEHYRAVTPCHSTPINGSGGGYQYPPVPLTFAERKRLSDTLFCFCKEIPGMMSDCAAILREAREKDDWDQAVAELLTQVVVGLYCGEGDSQLDGLQQYLLTLGASC